MLDYETCVLMDFDVPSVYSNVQSDIPEEHRVKMKDDQYIIFTDHTGKRSFLGMSWIKPDSIVELSDSTTTVVVKGNDVSKIKAALSYYNLQVLSTEVNNT